MHVLVAVDEVGQAAEGLDKGSHLRGDLDHQRSGCSRRAIAARIMFCERQETAVAQRREALAHRLERRGQRHVQAERGALCRRN